MIEITFDDIVKLSLKFVLSPPLPLKPALNQVMSIKLH
jgi:hypothetical protein